MWGVGGGGGGVVSLCFSANSLIVYFHQSVYPCQNYNGTAMTHYGRALSANNHIIVQTHSPEVSIKIWSDTINVTVSIYFGCYSRTTMDVITETNTSCYFTVVSNKRFTKAEHIETMYLCGISINVLFHEYQIFVYELQCIRMHISQ